MQFPDGWEVAGEGEGGQQREMSGLIRWVQQPVACVRAQTSLTFPFGLTSHYDKNFDAQVKSFSQSRALILNIWLLDAFGAWVVADLAMIMFGLGWQ